MKRIRFVIGCRQPILSDHGGELLLLGIIAVGVCGLAGASIIRGAAGESSAWTAVLMSIINAIKERWQGRSIDRMGQSLANAPPADPAAAPPPAA